MVSSLVSPGGPRVSADSSSPEASVPTETASPTDTATQTVVETPTSVATAEIPTNTIVPSDTVVYTPTLDPTSTVATSAPNSQMSSTPTANKPVDVSPTAVVTRTPKKHRTRTPVPTVTNSLMSAGVQAADSFPIVDDFESGELGDWNKINGLTVAQSAKFSGTYGAEAASTGAAAYARRNLPTAEGDVFLQVRFLIESQANNTVYLARYRTGGDVSILGVYITGAGRLGYRNDVSKKSVTSSTTVSVGVWHLLEMHATTGTNGRVEIWLDGSQTPLLANAEALGTESISIVQLGDNATGRTFDYFYDNLVVDTSFIPLTNAPTPTDTPTTPPTIAATPSSTPVASPTITNSTFADGFESGDITKWDEAKLMVVAPAAAHSGVFGVHAVSTHDATFLRKTLAAPQTDLYFRTYAYINSKSANTVYLMRLRSTADVAILGVYISGSERLGYRNDQTGERISTHSVVTPGEWHEIQVHLLINGASSVIQIWLDGTLVADGTTSMDNTPAGIVQIGENGTGTRSYDIAFDDVVASNAYISAQTDPTPTATTIPPSFTATSQVPTRTPTPTATATPTGVGTPPTPSVVITVLAAGETAPMPNPGDSADDPAIWIHPTDPSKSTIIGTDKLGGLAVYNLGGTLLYYYPGTLPNNVDLRYNFPLGGQHVALVVATDKSIKPAVIRIYTVNPNTGELTSVAARQIASKISARGMCMYHSPVSGKYYVFVNDNTNGKTEQWELYDNGSGLVDAKIVRTLSVGSTTEGCVADDEYGAFYVAEEDVALWRYDAEPDAGSGRTMVDPADGVHLSPDIEGLTLYYGSGGTGYLLASNQSKSEYAIYQRTGTNSYVGTFKISDGIIDGTFYTDGIDVTNFNLGGVYASGVFIAQDNTNNGGANQNFKLVPWDRIASQMTPPLIIDTSFDPRQVGAAP